MNCCCLNGWKEVRVFVLVTERKIRKQTNQAVLPSDHILTASLITSPSVQHLVGFQPAFQGYALPTSGFRHWLSFMLMEAEATCSDTIVGFFPNGEVLWKHCCTPQSIVLYEAATGPLYRKLPPPLTNSSTSAARIHFYLCVPWLCN